MSAYWTFHCDCVLMQCNRSTQAGYEIVYKGTDMMFVDVKSKKVKSAQVSFDALNLTYLTGLRTCYKKGPSDMEPDFAACACPCGSPGPQSPSMRGKLLRS